MVAGPAGVAGGGGVADRVGDIWSVGMGSTLRVAVGEIGTLLVDVMAGVKDAGGDPAGRGLSVPVGVAVAVEVMVGVADKVRAGAVRTSRAPAGDETCCAAVAGTCSNSSNR